MRMLVNYPGDEDAGELSRVGEEVGELSRMMRMLVNYPEVGELPGLVRRLVNYPDDEMVLNYPMMMKDAGELSPRLVNFPGW
jgi:hypothetical protein